MILEVPYFVLGTVDKRRLYRQILLHLKKEDTHKWNSQLFDFIEKIIHLSTHDLHTLTPAEGHDAIMAFDGSSGACVLSKRL